MDFSIYLAFTPAQWDCVGKYGGKAAWMGAKFSPSGSGITGLPTSLPPGSMLMLTDETPMDGHDPQQVADELARAANVLGCERVLLDFQREKRPEYLETIKAVADAVPCPVGISEIYAEELDCPVLLSPPLLWTPLSQHLAKWEGREIWLEAVLEGVKVTVTEAGADYLPWDPEELAQSHIHTGLHLRYWVEQRKTDVLFHLHRDRQQLNALLQEAHALGIQTAVGLYQQLGQ